VLVIDDHPLFCEALSLSLRRDLGLERVHAAHSLGAALAMIESGVDADLIALDLNLPDVSGIDGLVRLKHAAPRTPVVVVSAMSDNRIVAQALRAGAAGYIRKDSSGDALLHAVRAVLDGEICTPADFAAPDEEHGAEADVDQAVTRLTELTPQQLRILGLVCEGKLNKQIAFDLEIAETTVKAHITAILRKLGVQSRTQAVLVAQRASYAGITAD
jgi:DNA-binding NarL/FixJ family response regulator